MYSNRQAPSRDSCERLSYVDSVKHIVTGGFWYSEDAHDWVQAGPAVRNIASEVPEIAQILGIPETWDVTPGAARLFQAKESKQSFMVRVRAARDGEGPTGPATNPIFASPGDSNADHSDPRAPIAWPLTLCGEVSNLESANHQMTVHLRGSKFIRAKTFSTTTGDIASVGSYIIYKTDINSGGNLNVRLFSTRLFTLRLTSCSKLVTGVGRVLEILVPRGQPLIASHICIAEMSFMDSRHPALDLPCVELTTQRHVIAPKVRKSAPPEKKLFP